MTVAGQIASVVIPAHNEAATIGRNLSWLYQGVRNHEIDVLVVCNGCSDDTAVRVRRTVGAARVLEIARPSKAEAMRAGNGATDVFPRVHLDADVVLPGPDLRRLVERLGSSHALAAAPRRVVVTARSSVMVRCYYDVWEHLPRVEAGLFGRGAIALTEQGQSRVDALPDIMADDLAVSDAFADDERVVVEDAHVRVMAPRHVTDLVRRRVRVITGNAQADGVGVRRPGSSTSWHDLITIVADRPLLAVKVPIFLAVTLVSRLLACRAIRRGDFQTWLRDESSRS